jgi:hypothetical protein
MLANTNVIDKERLIAALELGYYGADLWTYIVLVYGESGWMAQTDPDELIANLRILESRAQQLLPPDDAVPIIEALAEVRGGCLSQKKTKSGWKLVEVHAKRVSTRLQKASSLLPLAESNVLDLGLQLGRIYHHTDDLPVVAVRTSIETKMRSVLPADSAALIKSRFASAKKLTDGYRWAMQIYSLLDHEIRFRL